MVVDFAAAANKGDFLICNISDAVAARIGVKLLTITSNKQGTRSEPTVGCEAFLRQKEKKIWNKVS